MIKYSVYDRTNNVYGVELSLKVNVVEEILACLRNEAEPPGSWTQRILDFTSVSEKLLKIDS